MVEFILISVFIFLFFIFLTLLISCFYVVRQNEVIVVERLGKYNKTLLPGLHFVFPFIESVRINYWIYSRYDKYSCRRVNSGSISYRIDLRESIFDFSKQTCNKQR